MTDTTKSPQANPDGTYEPVNWDKAYVQVYTGNGKGKTTAALGLALRAAGAGLKVFFAQFIKGKHYSEIAALARYADQIDVRQYGRGCFILKNPADGDISAAHDGLEDVRRMIQSGDYSVVVLDEANVAVQYGLFTDDELLEVIDSAPKGVELIITGRYAPPKILRRADLVTEMKEIKHYYNDGVMARSGIEM